MRSSTSKATPGLTRPNRNLAILRAAHAHLPALKSIAVTGSINAITTGMKDDILARPFTTDSWLPLTQADARAAQNAYLSYCSGKKEGELAVWDFVKAETPAFAVTVFLPALIFGPPIEPVADVRHLHYSSRIIYSFIDGSHDEIPATSFPSYVDVRDLAEAHVRSLTTEGARNKRFLIGGTGATYTDLVRSLSKVPELAGRLPAESGEDKNVVLPRIEAQEGNKVLGMKFRSLDETMRDAAERILQLEKMG
jgi:nucleoside-diphosphate-sugar epimerase